MSEIVANTELWECACGRKIKNNVEQIKRHLNSLIHLDYEATGNIHKIEVDENYPCGHWRRYYTSKKRCLRNHYHKKKRELNSV